MAEVNVDGQATAGGSAKASAETKRRSSQQWALGTDGGMVVNPAGTKEPSKNSVVPATVKSEGGDALVTCPHHIIPCHLLS